MRARTQILAVFSVTFLITFAALSHAFAMYGRAQISIRGKEHPLDVCKSVVEADVKPRFVAQLKEQDPETDGEELAEGITVWGDQERATLTIYVPAEDEKAAVKAARKIGEMAVARLTEMAESGRRTTLRQIRSERERVVAEIRALEDELAALQRDTGIHDPGEEMEFLCGRLRACKEGIAEAQVKRAELEAKLELYSRKSSELRESGSTKGIAVPEGRGDLLAMLFGEGFKIRHETEIKRRETILKQRGRELEELKPLYEKGYVSESRLKNAEDELELAKFEYKAARKEMEFVVEHQVRLREALACASQRLPGMGGSCLANILAEKTLECESELAAVQVRSRLLEHQMREIEREIAEKRSVGAEVEKRQAEIDARKRRAGDLLERESAVRLEMATERRAEVVVVEAVERIAELLPSYRVIGEVKKPGTFELLGQRTVMTAIGAAGGFTEYTNEKGIAVISNPGRRPKSHSLDLTVLLKGESSDEFTIQPGDVIWVPRKTVLR